MRRPIVVKIKTAQQKGIKKQEKSTQGSEGSLKKEGGGGENKRKKSDKNCRQDQRPSTRREPWGTVAQIYGQLKG